MVMAILLAGVVTKLGHGWWGIAVMVALCLLGTLRKAEATARRPLLRHASEPALG